MSRRGTILVVDDLPQNMRLLEAVLEPRGYTRARRGSGAGGARALAAEPTSTSCCSTS